MPRQTGWKKDIKDVYSGDLLDLLILFIQTDLSLKDLEKDRLNIRLLSYGYLRRIASRDKWSFLRNDYRRNGECMLPNGQHLSNEHGVEKGLDAAERKVTEVYTQVSNIASELDQLKRDLFDARQTIERQVKLAATIQLGNGAFLRKLNHRAKNLTEDEIKKLSLMELGTLMARVTNAIAKGAEMERRALGIDQQPVLLQQNSITYGDDIKSLPTEELIKIVEAEVDNA